VVWRTGIVDRLLVDDQCAPTRPQNSSGVCQSRPLCARGEASSDTTAPTLPSQLAASSFSKPGRTVPPPDRLRFVIDDLNIVPAELRCAFHQAILAALAFKVVDHLVDCRLTHIDKGARARCSDLITYSLAASCFPEVDGSPLGVITASVRSACRSASDV
jgi:hypothetical protein